MTEQEKKKAEGLKKAASAKGKSEVEYVLERKLTTLESFVRSEFSLFHKNNTRTCSQLTTVGGSATEVFTVIGAKAIMRIFVQMETKGGTPVTVITAKVALDQITIEFSADPGNDHVFNYALIC